jgi:cell division transport system permease protein
MAMRGRDLPLGRNGTGRFLPWAVALMVYLAGMGGLGLILRGGTNGRAGPEPGTMATLDVPQGVSAARMAVTLALLRETPGILGERVLAPEGGTDAAPQPAQTIAITTDPHRRIDLATLRTHLAMVVPGARLDDPAQRPAQHPMRRHRFPARARLVVGALAAAAAALIVPGVALAVAAGLASDRPVVELLHLLGARDRTIARWFEWRAWWQGLGGGAFGALGILLTGLVLSSPSGGIADPWADPWAWGLLVLLPPAAGLIATATARTTVLHRLATLP